MTAKPGPGGGIGILCGLNVILLAGGVGLTSGWDPPRAEYPAGPIRLIVPFGAGGGSDAYARIFKRAIDDHQLLPVPLVIQNRGGAGATIGSRYVRDAAPDGYTMLLLHDAIITAKYSGMVRYGPEAFEPIASTGELGMVIAVAADSEFESLDELTAQAVEKPGELSFAVNRGALTHVAGLLLEQAAPGAKFAFPQSGGGNDRFLDLAGHHVDVTGFSLEEFLRFRAGEDENDVKLRGLAYLDRQRHQAIPDVPTAKEQGYDITIINRFYWWAPKGTPPERIEVLADALHAALETDYVKQQMQAIHCERIFRTGSELEEQLEETEARIAQVEFTKPQGVPDMQKLVIAAAALLLLAWAWQSGSHFLQFGSALALIACWAIGAFIPAIDAWSLFALAAGLVVLFQHLRPIVTEPKALLCILGTLGYAMCLTLGWGDFRWLTILYVLVIGGILIQNRRQLLALGAIAQTLAFGLHAVFTFVFEAPLPTG